jgi:hypothetical protein
MKRAGLLLAAALALALSNMAAQAEVKKFAYLCGGGNQTRICPYYQLLMTPPDGWVLDDKATRANKAQMIVPKGKDFSSAPALIYIQVFYHKDRTQSLEDFAKVSNDRWLAEVKDAKITPLAAVPRDNGKAGFLRFAFDNPSEKQQAYEVGAFGIDADTDGNEFVLDVVMSGKAKSDLERAEKDYVGFLKAN